MLALMIRRLLILFLLAPAAAFAQVSSATTSSVTVTAALNQNLQADQAGFTVTIESGLNATIDDIMGALQGTGLTATNFSTVFSNQQYTNNGNPANLVLDWTFQLNVPLAGMKTEAAALNALATSLSQGQIPLTLSYSVQGLQTSTQAQVQSCALSDLVSAGRIKAQQIADAANLKIGSVLALSTSVSTMIGPSAITPYVVPACSLTMTFALGQQIANKLTVSVSRTVNAPPDQVTFGAYVVTPANGTLDDALTILSGTGVAAGNLIGVNTLYDQSGLEWQFSMAVPLSKMKDTLAAFQKAQSGILTPSGNPATVFSFSVQGTQLSAQLVAAQNCTNAALVADAQAYARQVAAATGVALNGIVGISDRSSVGASVPSELVAELFPVSGSFSGFLASTSPQTSPQPSCSLTVQFGIS